MLICVYKLFGAAKDIDKDPQPSLDVRDDDDNDDEGVAQAAGEPRLSEEEQYRKRRSKRAARVYRWMMSPMCHMWSFAATLAAAPISIVLGHYLQDEYMFSPNVMQHKPGELRPWQPISCGEANRPTPCLLSFMSEGMATLRSFGRSYRSSSVLD